MPASGLGLRNCTLHTAPGHGGTPAGRQRVPGAPSRRPSILWSTTLCIVPALCLLECRPSRTPIRPHRTPARCGRPFHRLRHFARSTQRVAHSTDASSRRSTHRCHCAQRQPHVPIVLPRLTSAPVASRDLRPAGPHEPVSLQRFEELRQLPWRTPEGAHLLVHDPNHGAGISSDEVRDHVAGASFCSNLLVSRPGSSITKSLQLL